MASRPAHSSGQKGNGPGPTPGLGSDTVWAAPKGRCGPSTSCVQGALNRFNQPALRTTRGSPILQSPGTRHKGSGGRPEVEPSTRAQEVLGHTYTHTRAHKHRDTHMQTRCVHTQAHTRTHTQTQTCVHAHTHAPWQCAPSHPHVHTCTGTGTLRRGPCHAPQSLALFGSNVLFAAFASPWPHRLQHLIRLCTGGRGHTLLKIIVIILANGVKWNFLPRGNPLI